MYLSQAASTADLPPGTLELLKEHSSVLYMDCVQGREDTCSHRFRSGLQVSIESVAGGQQQAVSLNVSGTECDASWCGLCKHLTESPFTGIDPDGILLLLATSNVVLIS